MFLLLTLVEEFFFDMFLIFKENSGGGLTF